MEKAEVISDTLFHIFLGCLVATESEMLVVRRSACGSRLTDRCIRQTDMQMQKIERVTSDLRLIF